VNRFKLAIPCFVLLGSSAAFACAQLTGASDLVVSDLEAGTPVGADGASGDGDLGGGQVDLGGVVIAPADLVLPEVGCGKPSTGMITLTNSTDRALPYELSSSDPTIALRGEATPVKDTLPPKGVVSIAVTASAPLPRTIAGEVSVSIDGKTQSIPTRSTIKGGMLELTPTLVDFGEVRQNTPVTPATIELANNGNEPVTVTGFSSLTGGGDFAIGVAPLTVPAGESRTMEATFAAGPAGPTLEAILTAATESPLCGAAPSVTLKGTRVNHDVTVTPATVDFGGVDCNSSSIATKIVTIKNYSLSTAASVTVSLTKGADSPFTLSATTVSAPVAVGDTPGTATIAIGRKPVDAVFGLRTDLVKFDISGAETSVKSVDAKLTVTGAMLTVSPTSMTLSPGGAQSFTISNTGNAFILLSHTTSNSKFKVTAQSALNPSSSTAVNVTAPVGFSSETTDITTVRIDSASPQPPSGALCAPAAAVKATSIGF
jgi:hypothetical protein